MNQTLTYLGGGEPENAFIYQAHAPTKPRLLCCVCLMGLKLSHTSFPSPSGALDSAFLRRRRGCRPIFPPRVGESSAPPVTQKKNKTAILTPACCRLDQNNKKSPLQIREGEFGSGRWASPTPPPHPPQRRSGINQTLLGYLPGVCMSVRPPHPTTLCLPAPSPMDTIQQPFRKIFSFFGDTSCRNVWNSNWTVEPRMRDGVCEGWKRRCGMKRG